MERDAGRVTVYGLAAVPVKLLVLFYTPNPIQQKGGRKSEQYNDLARFLGFGVFEASLPSRLKYSIWLNGGKQFEAKRFVA